MRGRRRGFGRSCRRNWRGSNRVSWRMFDFSHASVCWRLLDRFSSSEGFIFSTVCVWPFFVYMDTLLNAVHSTFCFISQHEREDPFSFFLPLYLPIHSIDRTRTALARHIHPVGFFASGAQPTKSLSSYETNKFFTARLVQIQPTNLWLLFPLPT